MGEPATVRTYGNTNLPEGAPERPLVTFVVFAYNQAKYIREAVEGALSQTYSPLEIILSDDCSSDGTFEIMKEMATDYQGPHSVKVRRNGTNLGTSLHVQFAFHDSDGVLFVVAAGDDISMPTRVERLIDTWVLAGRPIGVIHSGWETFNDLYPSVREAYPAKRTKYSGREITGYCHSYWLPAAAPTCGYSRELFDRFPSLPGGSIIEDAPLFLRAALIGKFVACNDALVRTRVHGSNSGTGYNVACPSRWNRFMQSKLIAFRAMQVDLAQCRDQLEPAIYHCIEARILEVLHSISPLLIPETRPLGLTGKIIFALRLVTAPAAAQTFIQRIDYMFRFFKVSSHVRFVRITRSIARRGF